MIHELEKAALEHAVAEISFDKREWNNHFRGGDMMLEGLYSKGYLNRRDDRYAISDAGMRFLGAIS